MDLLKSQLRSKNQWDLVPACLDMGKGESRIIFRNYGLIDNDIFKGREARIYLGEEIYTILDILSLNGALRRWGYCSEKKCILSGEEDNKQVNPR